MEGSSSLNLRQCYHAVWLRENAASIQILIVKKRIRTLYRLCPPRSAVVCFDEWGPLELKPMGGIAWARRKQPQRIRAHLVQTGLYRQVWHPAYAGLLLAYLAMGLAVGNWISAVLIFFPILLAALYRIRVEEGVLRDTFDQEYTDYSIRTKRFLPGIY